MPGHRSEVVNVPADAAPLLLQLVAAQARILRSHADPRERGDGKNRERWIVEAARLRRELAALGVELAT